ncbi:MAG TPA: hypothetical protein VFW25_01565 [Silvibacterium sp.]|nr:hypothetical protein [Silvibacterium sp.]
MTTILIAGLAAGTLDLALAITFFTISGAPLDAVPHAIASGLLGPRAFLGGVPTAILGVALHYFIALTVAAVYYFLSRKIRLLNVRPYLAGTVYGLAVFTFMQHIVLPLSREPRSHPTHAWLVADVASHIFFIGITIALITRYFAARLLR